MKTLKNWVQFNESKSGKIIYEMTGSPKDSMTMLPPKDRTKAVFAAELAKHGYVQGRLNKDCDLLVAQTMDTYTLKMKKAEEYGCKVTTYKSLIKKHKMFRNVESIQDEEVGQIELIFDGGSPTTWYYIEDAINDGLLDERLGLNDEILSEYATKLELEFDDLSMESLTDNIIDDFENELNNLFDFLIERGDLDHKPSVEISGTDENGEEYEFSYFSDVVNTNVCEMCKKNYVTFKGELCDMCLTNPIK